MKKQLEYLAVQRAQVAKDLEAIENRYWKEKNANNLYNKEIEELREKLRYQINKTEDLEFKLKHAAPEMDSLQDRLRQARDFANIALQNETDVRDKLENEKVEKLLMLKAFDEEKELLKVQIARLEVNSDSLEHRVHKYMDDNEALQFSVANLTR